jgi:hypothetical protein
VRVRVRAVRAGADASAFFVPAGAAHCVTLRACCAVAAAPCAPSRARPRGARAARRLSVSYDTVQQMGGIDGGGTPLSCTCSVQRSRTRCVCFPAACAQPLASTQGA